MASFSKRIKAKYDLNSYCGIKSNIEWIIEALENYANGEHEITTKVQFDIGDINCVCESLSEFTDHAYGQKELCLTNIDIYFRQNETSIFVNITYFSEVVIVADSKIILESIISLLENSREVKTTTTTTTVTNNYIENNYKMGDIIGDNVSVAQGEKAISIQSTKQKKKSKFKEWLEAIGQNLLSNIIWALLPIVLGIVLYLFFK